MTKILRLTASLILVFFVSNLFSQEKYEPGYILKAGNDTVWGEIKINTLADNAYFCEFKASGNQSIEHYAPDDIFAYRINNGRYYIAKKVKVTDSTEHLFLEYLVNGIVNLYFIKYKNSDYYFLEKGDELIKLSNDEIEKEKDGVKYIKNSNQYIGALSFTMQDAPGIANQIRSSKFTHKSLAKTTKNYHNLVCDDYECVSYSKNIKTKVYLEPIAGVELSYYGLHGANEKSTSLLPYGGLSFGFVPGVSGISWVYHIGLNYTAYKSDSYYYTDKLPQYNAKEFHLVLDYKKISVPILVEYKFALKHFYASLIGGVSLGFKFDKNNQVYKIITNSGRVVPMKYEFANNTGSLNGGIGFSYI